MHSFVLLDGTLIDPDALKLNGTAWLSMQHKFLLLLMILVAMHTHSYTFPNLQPATCHCEPSNNFNSQFKSQTFCAVTYH